MLNGIETSLKSELEEKFNCEIDDISIKFDKNYENIEKINIEIKNINKNEIEKVVIGNNIVEENNNEFENIKKYVLENYNTANVEIAN